MTNFVDLCNEKIDSGECTNNCCGNIPIPLELWRMYSKNISVEYKIEVFDQMIYPKTEDEICVFLDKVKCRCLIYEERPSICAMFGSDPTDNVFLQCPFMNYMGKKRTRQQRRKLDRERAKRIQSMISSLRSATSDETALPDKRTH